MLAPPQSSSSSSLTWSCANRRSAARRARSRTCVRKRASVAVAIFSSSSSYGMSSKCAWEDVLLNGEVGGICPSAFVTLLSSGSSFFDSPGGSSLSERPELRSAVRKLDPKCTWHSSEPGRSAVRLATSSSASPSPETLSSATVWRVFCKLRPVVVTDPRR